MRTTVEDGVLTLYPEGHVNSQNAAAFEQETMAAFNSAPGASVVVDAEDLEYISSAGLRVLMRLMRLSGQTLPIINASRNIYEILDVTGFTDIMDVQERP